MFYKSNLSNNSYQTKIISSQIYFFVYFLAIGLCLLILALGFLFLPSAKVILKVTSEPLIVNFEIKLDTQIKNILFNLDSIPAYFIDLDNDILKKELIPGLVNQNIGKAIVFNEDDLLEIIDYKIKHLIDFKKKMVVEMSKKNLSIEVKNSDFNAGQALINVSIKNRLINNYNLLEIKQKIAHQKISDAKEYLSNLQGVKSVQIKNFLSPFQRMPLFPQRIDILLDIF